MSEAITSVYAQVPIPKFYVVTGFEEIPDGDPFVGGVKNARFVRFRVDHIARTLPGPILREWWVRTVDTTLKPWVGDRGFDLEISIDETPFDLWSLQGEVPPPVHRREAVVRREPGKQLHRRREASRRAAVRTRSDGPSVRRGFVTQPGRP